MQWCSCVLAVWDLFTVGKGTGRKKINLRQQWEVTKRGRAKTDGEKSREAVEPDPASVPAFPPQASVYTQRNFGQFHSSPFSDHSKGQIPSWLLTLYPGKVVAIMGKSKPLASSVGYLPASRYSLSANSGPAQCLWNLCARGSGHIAGIKSNRTPHSGGPLSTVGSVCIHVVLSASPVGASLTICSVLENVYGFVSYMRVDPARCRGHKKPPPVNQTTIPRGQGGMHRQHPLGMNGREETTRMKRRDAYERMYD